MAAEKNELPLVVQYSPYYSELEAGESYLWCSCGLSKTQPFCDQSHRGTDFKPVRYVAQQPGEEVLFCGCKQTLTPPFCDGAHSNLKDEYENDDPNSPENQLIQEVLPGADGRAVLNGGCYVTRVDHVSARQLGTLAMRTVISAATGALYQSQFCLTAATGESPILSYGDRHVVLMVTAGTGSINISGESFPLKPEMGVYVRPNEAFSIDNPAPEELKIFATVCPLVEAPEVLESMPENFQRGYPQRTVQTDLENRTQMGNRFWQILVDKKIGSTMATQFIGEVPESKALPHRHLYEESLVVLQGEGYMWTENAKAHVTAGDIIFLPRKQIHSLQCTVPGGMYLSGIIYPGDNPSINYY